MAQVTYDTPRQIATLSDQVDTMGRVTITSPPQELLDDPAGTWRDLAPEILRQRLVIEGVPSRPVDDALIRTYLSALSGELDMVALLEPVTHRSDRYGWAGWIHWETSGAHFYAWEQPRLFFSVDIYTCKGFDPDVAVAFTADLLAAGTVVAKSF